MGSCSGYSLLVFWQITVVELSWPLTNFHWGVFHGGEPSSSVTVNFPNLITANQKCEEKLFLWVSGAQQAGQPTCGVWTSVCLSGQGKWCTLQILQHVKAAESPIKRWDWVWKLCNPFEFSRKGYGKFCDGKRMELSGFCCNSPHCRMCGTCSYRLTQYAYLLKPSNYLLPCALIFQPKLVVSLLCSKWNKCQCCVSLGLLLLLYFILGPAACQGRSTILILWGSSEQFHFEAEQAIAKGLMTIFISILENWIFLPMTDPKGFFWPAWASTYQLLPFSWLGSAGTEGVMSPVWPVLAHHSTLWANPPFPGTAKADHSTARNPGL